jgi:lysophospholipase L1-like esterase
MTPEEFSQLLPKLAPYTDYLYFHLMGEPLCHPSLGTFLEMAGNAGFKVILTTNGTLLRKQQDLLLHSPSLHKINISLHAFEANDLSVPFNEYLSDCLRFGQAANGRVIVSYRLWNSGGKESLQVWTPASRTLTLDQAVTTTILYPDTGEEITIKDAIARKKPEILVITLGVNGISYMNEEYFTSSYKKLVNMIAKESPDTKIILQSIFPVATNWEKTKSINNEKITNANKWIRAVADACSVRYLDTISVLAIDEGGYLPQKLQNGDGLHLNGTGCDIVLQYIRTHALPDYIE